jgi:hypothetical protein
MRKRAVTDWKLGVALALLAALLGAGVWFACAPAPRVEHADSPAPTQTPAAPRTPSSTPVPAQPDARADFMQRLRAASDTDPALALQLAREDERDNPDGPDAAERSALIVKSLARQGRLSEARGEAEKLVSRYPDTRWALEVEQQTGAHPRRNQ